MPSADDIGTVGFYCATLDDIITGRAPRPGLFTGANNRRLISELCGLVLVEERDVVADTRVHSFYRRNGKAFACGTMFMQLRFMRDSDRAESAAMHDFVLRLREELGMQGYSVADRAAVEAVLNAEQE